MHEEKHFNYRCNREGYFDDNIAYLNNFSSRTLEIEKDQSIYFRDAITRKKVAIMYEP